MEPRLERPVESPRRRGSAALARLATSPVTSRVIVFAGADVLTTALGGIVTLLLARSLSTTQYGSYSFATSALAFAAMFFEFGLFLPTARRLAQGRGHPGEVVAAATTAYLPVGVAFAVLVFALSFGVDGWFHVDAGTALRAVAPLALVYPYDFVALLLAQGLDRIRLYSLTRTATRAAAAAALGALLLAGHRLSVALALAVESGALLLAWTAYTLRLRPAYRNLAPQVRGFVREARQYGFQVYLGRVLSTGTYNMDTLMVAAFTDARSVGFYALANAIAYPVALPGAGLAAALFPRMAREPRLEQSWLLGAGLLSLATGGLGQPGRAAVQPRRAHGFVPARCAAAQLGGAVVMRAVVARLRRARSLPPGVVAAEIAWRAARGGLRSAMLLRDRSSERVLATGGKPWAPFLSQGWSPPSAESLPPGALEACLREADAAIAGRFQVLGHGLLDFGRPPSWHSDPVTGASWRSDARGRRALVTASVGADIKVPWEASRMHWLVALARAGRYTADPGYARAAAGLLQSWRRDNPIGRGVNWCNAMEGGIRAVNLVWASEILQDRSVDRLVGAMLPAHGRQILGNLEYSPRLTSNHYLADVVGLLYVGAALRRTLTGRAWLRFAAGALGREVCKQFDEDGVNFEASIGYHRLSTELVLFGVLAMDRLGLRPPPAAGARLGRAIEVLASLREPDGLLPAVGDDDSGLVVNLASERHPRDPAPLIGTGRALLAGSASQCAGGEFQQWAVGGAAAAPPPRAPVVALPRSGRFVLANRAIWCLVECGEVGQRGNGGHAHNDTLSFVLAVRGRELVTDPGSGTYTRDPVLRDRFRGT